MIRSLLVAGLLAAAPIMAKATTFNADERSEIARQARVELAQRYAKEKDILNWGKMLFPDKFPLPFCQDLHGYFVDIRGEELTSTEAPRYHSKTTIKCFLIPIFQALEEPDTFRHYLSVQGTEKKALAVNLSVKEEIETNRELLEIYGRQIGSRKWTDQQFALANGVIFTAVGAGQSIRGINYRNIRPDYIGVDDLYDEEDINNPNSTIKKNNWFWGSLFPARAKARRTSIHVQGTAINNEDLLHEQKGKKRWKSRTFKAVTDWEKKKVLWPELNTFESLLADRVDMGSVIFFREMQNDRRDETTAIIKRAWLKNWEYDPAELEFGGDFTLSEIRLGCDPSIGKNCDSDFTGIALVYKSKPKGEDSSRYHIHALWNEHLTLNGRVLKLKGIGNDPPGGHKIGRAYIEGISGFQDFVGEVKRRTDLPVRLVSSVKDKITNLENKSHFFENEKVFLNQDIDPKLKDMILYQLTTNYPKHDDLRDGVLLCMDGGKKKQGMRFV